MDEQLIAALHTYVNYGVLNVRGDHMNALRRNWLIYRGYRDGQKYGADPAWFTTEVADAILARENFLSKGE